MSYRLGLSFLGLIVVLLAMLPNFIYFLFPPLNPPTSAPAKSKVFDLIESMTRIGFILLLIFLVSAKKADFQSPLLIFMLLFLFLYYVLWVRYFVGGRDYQLLGRSFLFVPVPLAVFPVLYFILAALWLGNFPAAVVTILFGVVHTIISYQSFH